MRVVPVRPSSNSRSYCYVANSTWSSQSNATEPYETPENIRSDLATDQIKAFRENPCRGIARLAATATKHDLYIALVLRVRDRVFQRIVASILNYGGPNAPASISSISAPPNQRYEYRRSA
jgi:peptide subunit release factor 1 (eRF1)